MALYIRPELRLVGAAQEIVLSNSPFENVKVDYDCGDLQDNVTYFDETAW